MTELPNNSNELMSSEITKRVTRRLEHLGSIPALTQAPGSDKPTKISSWLQVVQTVLSPAGDEVSTWWSWTVAVAQEAHSRYVATPKLERLKVRVTVRTP